MEETEFTKDLLFCATCGKHFRGTVRPCPNGCGDLEPVSAFAGEVGDVVDDRYVLLEELGTGGMGTVYRAEDVIANREVALKLLNTEYAGHAASAQRFLREARMMRAVKHRATATLHRFGPTAEGLLIIDMEYVSGKTAREHVLAVEGGLEIKVALNVLDHLLAALAATHDAGVVHCDVKPENVILLDHGRIGQCKLIDFGIAQPPGTLEHGESLSVLGTPAYMSPEQVRGRSVDGRTDLYLVGCFAYELLTGEPPFLAAAPQQLCYDQVHTEPPPLGARMDVSRLPSGLEPLLASLLAKRPEDRPTSARIVRQALRDLRARSRRRAIAPPRQPRARLRPPSNELLRRIEPPPQPTASATEGPLDSIHALIEIRQISDKGTLYGPRAVQEIAVHVLAGVLQDLRDAGAQVIGPEGPHIELCIPCANDERGVVSHTLDSLAEIQAALSRIPEPRLEIRAAVVARKAKTPLSVVQMPTLNLLGLLNIGPGSYVRVDAKVARWAGRRQLVRLGEVHDVGDTASMTLYATSLVAP